MNSSTQPFIQLEGFTNVTQGVVQYGFGTRELSDDVTLWSKALDLSPNQWVTLKQIHSKQVVVVDKSFDFSKEHAGDALITNRQDVVLAVRSADCLPVLLFDPIKKVVAAVHAGWRGLVAQILIDTIEVMNHRFGVDVRDLQVAFGPCLQLIRFEVGEEVVEIFRQELGYNFSYERLDSGKFLIDMPCTAAMGLEQLGLFPKNFYFSMHDTYSESSLFHSYRRDLTNSGRQLNFIHLLS